MRSARFETTFFMLTTRSNASFAIRGQLTDHEAAVPRLSSRGAASQWNASDFGETGSGAVTAGFVSRLLAFVIDIFAMALIAVVVIQAATLTAEFFGSQR